MHVKVGLLFSLTGTTSLTEQGQYDAALFAMEQLKATHDSIEAVTVDINSDPAKARAEAERLAKAGVKLFIGCYTSACRKAVLPILEKYDCLLVYPTLYEGQENHPNVFYTGEVPNQQVHTLIDYLMAHYGKNIYLIGNDYIYPQETNAQVKRYVARKAGNILGETYVPFGNKDFHAIVQDIIVKKPDAIFSTLVGQSVPAFYDMYYQSNLNPSDMPIFSPITKETEIEAMGTEVGCGHYGSASYFHSLDNPLNQRFTMDFNTFIGEERVISSVMYNTYVGVKIILEAIGAEKTFQKEKIFPSLHRKKVESPCGELMIDAKKRHLTRPVRIGRANAEGQFEIVWNSEHNIQPKPYIQGITIRRPAYEIVLHAWGEVSKEAMIAVSESQSILYVSKRAKKLTNLSEGDQMTPRLFQTLHHKFSIQSFEAKKQTIIMLKEKYKVLEDWYEFGTIQTKSDLFQRELKTAHIAATSIANVLITGETGTGKEVLAQSIHEQSDRKDKPFIAVNMAALPKELIMSELFGYVDGAFTGAKKGGAIGKFEAANGGTLFLDEIGDMPLELQVVLLRALETRKIIRLGDVVERTVDIRIIAATNRDLEEEIAYHDSFRSDLYYRLNVLGIDIPALRERCEDIPALVNHFFERMFELYGEGPTRIEEEVIQTFIQYPWPGNIRELRNVMERAYLLAKNDAQPMMLHHLPKNIVTRYKNQPAPKKSLKEAERKLIEKALQEAKNVTEASEKLGIGRSTLYRKMKQFKLSM